MTNEERIKILEYKYQRLSEDFDILTDSIPSPASHCFNMLFIGADNRILAIKKHNLIYL